MVFGDSSKKQGEATEQSPTFKQQLDKAAHDAKFGPPERQPTIVDKVSEYVPAVGKLLGKDDSEKDKPSSPSQADPGIPPVRPDHDPHIEEFVRDQHRSKAPDGKVLT